MLRRFLQRLSQTDEELLAEEVLSWAGSVPGTVRIADAPLRCRVKLAGVVNRITVRPVAGFEALEAVIWDGTGEVVVRWLGRRFIPGLVLGSRLIVEGVVGQEHDVRANQGGGRDHGVRRMVNATYEFG